VEPAVAALTAAPPNRVLMLEDTDGAGRFDRSTVFADAMTFPQGAHGSPPTRPRRPPPKASSTPSPNLLTGIPRW